MHAVARAAPVSPESSSVALDSSRSAAASGRRDGGGSLSATPLTSARGGSSTNRDTEDGHTQRSNSNTPRRERQPPPPPPPRQSQQGSKTGSATAASASPTGTGAAPTATSTPAPVFDFDSDYSHNEEDDDDEPPPPPPPKPKPAASAAVDDLAATVVSPASASALLSPASALDVSDAASEHSDATAVSAATAASHPALLMRVQLDSGVLELTVPRGADPVSIAAMFGEQHRLAPAQVHLLGMSISHHLDLAAAQQQAAGGTNSVSAATSEQTSARSMQPDDNSESQQQKQLSTPTPKRGRRRSSQQQRQRRSSGLARMQLLDGQDRASEHDDGSNFGGAEEVQPDSDYSSSERSRSGSSRSCSRSRSQSRSRSHSPQDDMLALTTLAPGRSRQRQRRDSFQALEVYSPSIAALRVRESRSQERLRHQQQGTTRRAPVVPKSSSSNTFAFAPRHREILAAVPDVPAYERVIRPPEVRVRALNSIELAREAAKAVAANNGSTVGLENAQSVTALEVTRRMLGGMASAVVPLDEEGSHLRRTKRDSTARAKLVTTAPPPPKPFRTALSPARTGGAAWQSLSNSTVSERDVLRGLKGAPDLEALERTLLEKEITERRRELARGSPLTVPAEVAAEPLAFVASFDAHIAETEQAYRRAEKARDEQLEVARRHAAHLARNSNVPFVSPRSSALAVQRERRRAEKRMQHAEEIAAGEVDPKVVQDEGTIRSRRAREAAEEAAREEARGQRTKMSKASRKIVAEMNAHHASDDSLMLYNQSNASALATRGAASVRSRSAGRYGGHDMRTWQTAREKDEAENCTFKPKLSEMARAIGMRPRSPIWARSPARHRDRTRSMVLREMELKAAEEAKHYTHRPAINPVSDHIARHRFAQQRLLSGENQPDGMPRLLLRAGGSWDSEAGSQSGSPERSAPSSSSSLDAAHRLYSEAALRRLKQAQRQAAHDEVVQPFQPRLSPGSAPLPDEPRARAERLRKQLATLSFLQKHQAELVRLGMEGGVAPVGGPGAAPALLLPGEEAPTSVDWDAERARLERAHKQELVKIHASFLARNEEFLRRKQATKARLDEQFGHTGGRTSGSGSEGGGPGMATGGGEELYDALDDASTRKPKSSFTPTHMAKPSSRMLAHYEQHGRDNLYRQPNAALPSSTVGAATSSASSAASSLSASLNESSSGIFSGGGAPASEEEKDASAAGGRAAGGPSMTPTSRHLIHHFHVPLSSLNTSSATSSSSSSAHASAPGPSAPLVSAASMSLLAQREAQRVELLFTLLDASDSGRIDAHSVADLIDDIPSAMDRRVVAAVCESMDRKIMAQQQQQQRRSAQGHPTGSNSGSVSEEQKQSVDDSSFFFASSSSGDGAASSAAGSGSMTAPPPPAWSLSLGEFHALFSRESKRIVQKEGGPPSASESLAASRAAAAAAAVATSAGNGIGTSRAGASGASTPGFGGAGAVNRAQLAQQRRGRSASLSVTASGSSRGPSAERPASAHHVHHPAPASSASGGGGDSVGGSRASSRRGSIDSTASAPAHTAAAAAARLAQQHHLRSSSSLAGPIDSQNPSLTFKPQIRRKSELLAQKNHAALLQAMKAQRQAEQDATTAAATAAAATSTTAASASSKASESASVSPSRKPAWDGRRISVNSIPELPSSVLAGGGGTSSGNSSTVSSPAHKQQQQHVSSSVEARAAAAGHARVLRPRANSMSVSSRSPSPSQRLGGDEPPSPARALASTPELNEY